MKRLIYRPEAEADIDGIWDYTMATWGLDQAIRYDEQLRATIEGLAAGRTASRPAPHVQHGLRQAQAGRHVVFFRADAAAVTVVRVLHQRMDVGQV